jgi:hypothetical protein
MVDIFIYFLHLMALRLKHLRGANEYASNQEAGINLNSFSPGVALIT